MLRELDAASTNSTNFYYLKKLTKIKALFLLIQSFLLYALPTMVFISEYC